MKNPICLVLLMIAACAWRVAAAAAAPPIGEPAVSKSPYFLVKSDSDDVDRLPLKSTSVEVQVSGVIADVTVRQVYANEGLRTIEAVYIFPAGTRAAVHGMRMRIGERTIVASVEARAAARRIYEQARQAGQSASLLEQQRPNVFQMNVANILPGDTVTVELRYTELLVPADGTYQFVYPTVVGPRYTADESNGDGSDETWTANPYLHQGAPSGATFDISVDLSAGLPIWDVACDSHPVTVRYGGKQQAVVKLAAAESSGANRDFILNYRLSGGRIETGLLLYEGESENFFLAMLQPPRHVRPENIPPREYVFIVDVSGSMHGFPLDISKKLIADLLGGLRSSDRFNILLFAGGSELMAPQSIPATPANIRRALDLIDRQQGGGGTELLPALERALSLPRDESTARSVVIATDGYVTVETEAFDLIRSRLGEATMIPFGIGASVNRYLIEGLAHVGMGEPFVVTDPADAGAAAAAFRKLIATPVMTGIRIDFGRFDVYDVQPPAIPDLLADRPVIVFGKYRGVAQGRLRLKGRCGAVAIEQDIDVESVKPLPANRGLRYLWARHRIALLADYNRLGNDAERTREVTELGLAYNLLTETTSFVAVDTRRRAANGEPLTVKQPLPLPQGVSDLAVGGAAPAVARMAKLAASPPPAADAEIREAASDKASGGKDEATVSAHLELVLESVRAPGLDETAVKSRLESRLEDIGRCLAALAESPPPRFSVRITVDANGRVVSVDPIPENADRPPPKCLSASLQALRFPVPAGSRHHRLVATFAVK